MKKFSSEFAVGLFFILCIIGLLYLTLSTGKVSLKNEGYYIYVKFRDISGLQRNAPVMVNGLEAGRVQDIETKYTLQGAEILLKLLINKDIKIGENPKISIKTLGLMGEKYVHIGSYQGNSFIKPGTTLEGKASSDLDFLMEKAEDLSKDFSVLLDNVNSLTLEVKNLAKNLNYTVEGNQDTISKIVKNLEVTTKNLEELTFDLKKHPWKLLHKGKE
ncbi:MAG TPA: MCE family protein [Candidatus Omnitrophica bacterium]|nr:MAG: hypothetical protein DRP61_04930 [Candidatus Omnitrophota bacterium]RKY34641.1 MAG: hypothetical protein DRP69_04060 [Candidatus Omnitrophota bacterium]RKY43523.1 MAG: hypothetical protein DRP80_05020 [Candidatus Omnitrophota bacterium]HEC69838.1 MCE family protein [Candidatus Omnitrophota bacterium]